MGKFNSNQKTIIYSNYPIIQDTLSPHTQISLASSECGFAIEDLLPVKYWLCSYGSNNNNDFWGSQELSYASPTIMYKPININHDRNEKHNYPNIIIGVNYASEVQENPKNNKESILAKAVLFSHLYKDLPIFQEICEDIKGDNSYASMECAFSEFSPVHPETGELLEDINSEEELYAAMKSKKASRRFDNPLFIGSAFLKGKHPADKDCTVSLDDLTVYSVEDNKVQYFTEAQDNILNIALVLHRSSHEAYNLYVEYGYGDSLDKIITSHDNAIEQMSKMGIYHKTPIDVFDKKSTLFLPVIQGWVGNSRVEMNGIATQDIVTVYNNEPDTIVQTIPIEYKDRIMVKKEDISALTKCIEDDIKILPLLYNNSKELLSISTLYISKKLSDRVKAEAKIGDIPELGLKDTTWIVINDEDIIYFNPNVNIYPMASELLGKGEKLDISYIRKRFGNKEIYSELNLIPCNTITITQKESLFTVLNSPNEVFGSENKDIYLWEKKGDSVLLWKIGDNSNTDIVASKDFIIEGYSNNNFNDIIYWDTYLHLPYKERLKILQENFPVVNISKSSVNILEKDILQYSCKNNIIVKEANSIEFNNMELVPGWFFEVNVIEKCGEDYIIGNDVCTGIVQSDNSLTIGDKITIACKWIVPNGNKFLLKEIDVIE